MKFVGKWIELGNIILSDFIQIQKDKHLMLPNSCEDPSVGSLDCVFSLWVCVEPKGIAKGPLVNMRKKELKVGGGW